MGLSVANASLFLNQPSLYSGMWFVVWEVLWGCPWEFPHLGTWPWQLEPQHSPHAHSSAIMCHGVSKSVLQRVSDLVIIIGRGVGIWGLYVSYLGSWITIFLLPSWLLPLLALILLDSVCMHYNYIPYSRVVRRTLLISAHL